MLHRRPLWPLVVLAAAAVVALAVTLVVVRRHDDRPRAAVGQLFTYPFREDPLPRLGEVLLPWVRTEIGVSRPRAELPTISESRPMVQAPDGGSFVRVEITTQGAAMPTVPTLGSTHVERAEVVLRADGRDYPLSTPDGLVLDPDRPVSSDASRWVAVAGNPRDLDVRVTLDGVTQVVSLDGSVDAGRAAVLADLDPATFSRTTIPCGTPVRIDTTRLALRNPRGLDCTSTPVRRTPYVAGLGWAGTGREYVVVEVAAPGSVHPTTGRGDDTQFWDQDGARLITRLGTSPAIDAPGALDPALRIFDVAAGAPTGDLSVDLVIQATLGAPFVTERREVRLRWTIPAEELA